ncbi:MAG TPA: hypothetical protein VFR70_07795 [Flavobacterium sp.]|nr:hypothetical protein [Flavobacterium sp.]
MIKNFMDAGFSALRDQLWPPAAIFDKDNYLPGARPINCLSVLLSSILILSICAAGLKEIDGKMHFSAKG